jgi:hypothetical protein
MRTKGLEPSLREKLEPKSSASTNSAMSAGINLTYNSTLFPERKPPTKSRDRQFPAKPFCPHRAPGPNLLGIEKTGFVVPLKSA